MPHEMRRCPVCNKLVSVRINSKKLCPHNLGRKLCGGSGSLPEEPESSTSPLQPKYSGPQSEAFWARLATLDDPNEKNHLYLLGCILQDVEGRVFQAIREAEEKLKDE